MNPASVEGAIILGIVAGLLTSALLYVSSLLLKKVVLPWYANFIYDGVDLRGIWIREFDENSAHYSVELSLDQNAHRITGTGTLKKSGTGTGDYVQFFTVSGSTWEGFLVVEMKSTNRKSLSFVAGLFKVKDRGNSLIGHWVYRAGHTDEAESEALQLQRQT